MESTRDDISSWVKIFLTAVSILIALNIGISVWQIGSMARKEVSENIEGLNDQIEALLSETEKQFDSKISDFKDNMNNILSKIESLENRSDENISQTNQQINILKNAFNEMMDNLQEESEKIKNNSKRSIEKLYSKTK